MLCFLKAVIDSEMIMDSIIAAMDKALDELLSVSAEIATFVQRNDWKRIDRLCLDRRQVIDRLEKLSREPSSSTQADRDRWRLKLVASDRIYKDVSGLISKYQEHLRNQLGSLSDQKIVLLTEAGVSPKGSKLTTQV